MCVGNKLIGIWIYQFSESIFLKFIEIEWTILFEIHDKSNICYDE